MKTAFQTSVQYSNCLVFAAGSISTSSKRFSIFSTPVAKAKSQGGEAGNLSHSDPAYDWLWKIPEVVYDINYWLFDWREVRHITLNICSHQRTAIASKPLTYPLTKCQIRNCRTVSTVPTSLKRSTCNVHPNGFNMHFNALLCNKHISACLRLPPCADLVFEFMLGDSSISHNDHAGP